MFLAALKRCAAAAILLYAAPALGDQQLGDAAAIQKAALASFPEFLEFLSDTPKNGERLVCHRSWRIQRLM